MNSYKLRFRSFLSRNLNPLFLILLWSSGLLLGMFISYYNPRLFFGLEYAALFTKPSVFCLLVSNLVPIITVYLFIKFSLDALCYPFVFLGGVSIGFCGIGLYCLFLDSAWLIRFFLMFSNSVATVFFWLLLFRNIRSPRIHLQMDLYLSLILVLLITVIDANFVAPFLSDIYTI